MTSVDVHGVTLEYETHGADDGEPVLLVMGLGAQLITWPVTFIGRLVDAGYRVITFDNRDIGRSARIDAPAPSIAQLALSLVAPGRARAKAAYALADMADDAAGLLDHLGIERAHVVGASMGGMISQELTIRHPERVASLTSIMSNTGARSSGRASAALLPLLARTRRAGGDPEAEAIAVGRAIGGPHFDEAGARDLFHLATSRAGDPAAAQAGLARQTLAVTTTRDRRGDLARITAPTLVVHGLLDKLVSPSGGRATARAVPGSRLVMYPDMAHDVPGVRVPELTAEIVENCRRAPIRVAATAS